MNPSAPLPPHASWRHVGARSGYEVVFPKPYGSGHRFLGSTAATEDGSAWFVEYDLVVDDRWRTRRAVVSGRTERSWRRIVLESDGAGAWTVDGEPAADLAGCLDVDLESSALTNAFPLRREAPPAGERLSAPAAYVRATDLTVSRLEQEYVGAGRLGGTVGYEYTAPAFGFSARLRYDEAGLVVDYAGLAQRDF